jgi:hypothetical protein
MNDRKRHNLRPGPSLRFRLGLAETSDPVAIFPLAAFLEQFRALKTLEHISFAAQRGSRAQTSML